MKHKAPILISILSIALFTSAVAAHDNFSKKRGDGGNMNNGIRAMKQLDLTDIQKEQLKELYSQRKEGVSTGRSQRNEIRNLINLGDVNNAAEIAATQARERVANIAETKQAVAAILTAEQLTELNTLQAERQLKREERAQRRADRRVAKADTSTS